jgi:hypothetical protein
MRDCDREAGAATRQDSNTLLQIEIARNPSISAPQD